MPNDVNNVVVFVYKTKSAEMIGIHMPKSPLGVSALCGGSSSSFDWKEDGSNIVVMSFAEEEEPSDEPFDARHQGAYLVVSWQQQQQPHWTLFLD